MVLSIRHLDVRYSGTTAVDGLEMELDAGQSLALLGLNGAGKTSAIRAVLGMTPVARGEISLISSELSRTEAFSQIGYAPEEALPPEFLSCRNYLHFTASFKLNDGTQRLREVTELLQWFELEPKKKVYQCSKGMRRRLLLAQAFIGKPKLLILDEPLNGLDPLLIRKLRERLEAYRLGGGAVLLCSHILAEVEKMATQVMIMKTGKVVLNQSTEKVIAEFGSVEEAFSAKVGT